MNWELDYNEYEKLARRLVADGIVMLQNDDNVLPLKKNTRLAVFGRMQNHYYRSGSGSGGMVNAPINVSILDACLECSDIVLDEELIKIYRDWEALNPYKHNKGWGMEYWSQDEMPVSKELAEGFAKSNDVALVIIARTAGEDRDNSGEEGSFSLQKEEEMLLDSVCSTFEKVVVLLNVGNVIDMSWVERYKPQSILLGWQGGMMGAYGTVDVLTGVVSPSACLPDTIAEKISDYPSDANFGDEINDVYQEDIYVGYRYFETFAKDKVLYPFGYGLSYTSFDVNCTQFDISDGISLKVYVTNTGECAGRKVVQVYSEAPQGKLGKPSRVLVGFAKTSELAPGSSEELVIDIASAQLASYDDSDDVITKLVMEAGLYTIYVGDNVRDAISVGSFEIDTDVVIEEYASAMKPIARFDRMKAESSNDTISIAWEKAPQLNRSKETQYYEVPDASYIPDKETKFDEVLNGNMTIHDFVRTLPDEDLFSIVRGEGMRSKRVTLGTASAFGGNNDHLKSLNVPCGCCDDGPSGMRLDTGKKAFSMPNGSMLASTFDTELVSSLFRFTGIEMRKNKVDVLLGPGMNIHRHPYNGRNFEYLSEDPLLTGRIAAAQLRALHSVGVDGCIKHFCGNNQETKRYSLNCVVSERALREIYLKGFEIAVKEADAHFVMTTYGRINSMWTSNYYDLTQVILREQWGFDGMVMTDWWAAINENGQDDELGIPGSHTNFASMVKAHNDTYMCTPDSSKNLHGDNLAEALENGFISRGELATAAEHVLSTLLRLPTGERARGDIQEVVITNYADYWDEASEVISDTFDVNGSDVYISLENVKAIRGSSYSFMLRFDEPGEYTFELNCSTGSELHVPVPATLLVKGEPIEMLTFFDEDKDADVLKDSTKIIVPATESDSDKLSLPCKLFFSHDGLVVLGMRLSR